MPTVDQLRKHIDSGLGADKVAFADPAAAPLGTDDEAAGTSPGPERIAMALQLEKRTGKQTPSSGTDERARPLSGEPIGPARGFDHRQITAGFVAAAVLAFVFFLYWWP